MPTTASHPPRPGLARRLLGSQLVDLMLGPHGVDRYLELIRPTLTVGDARAEVVAVRRQTARSVTLTVRPNRAWAGFQAGQYVAVGVEIDGVRRTRTYSPAGSAHHRRELELTVTEHPGGLVSGHLLRAARTGSIVHLATAQGEFTLPQSRPERIVLISGGSGITPVLSMLRTLIDEGHDGEIAFLHFARTEADWLYQPEVRALAQRHPGLRVALSHHPRRRSAPPRRARIVEAHRRGAERHCRRLRPTEPGRRSASRMGSTGRGSRAPAHRDLHPAARPRHRRGGDGDAALPGQRPDRARSARARCSSRPRRRGCLPRSAAGWASATRARAVRRPGRCATCAPARSPTRRTRTSSCASRPRPATSRWSYRGHLRGAREPATRRNCHMTTTPPF